MELYPARIKDLYGFIDEFGNVKTDFKYLSAESFMKGYCVVETLNDTNDNVVISDFDYDSLLIVFDKNRIIAGDFEGRFCIIDSKNNKISDFIFDYIAYHPRKLKFYVASCNGKYGLIDRNGKALKINKESLNIPETKINYKNLTQEEILRVLFT